MSENGTKEWNVTIKQIGCVIRRPGGSFIAASFSTDGERAAINIACKDNNVPCTAAGWTRLKDVGFELKPLFVVDTDETEGEDK